MWKKINFFIPQKSNRNFQGIFPENSRKISCIRNTRSLLVIKKNFFFFKKFFSNSLEEFEISLIIQNSHNLKKFIIFGSKINPEILPKNLQVENSKKKFPRKFIPLRHPPDCKKCEQNICPDCKEPVPACQLTVVEKKKLAKKNLLKKNFSFLKKK